MFACIYFSQCHFWNTPQRQNSADAPVAHPPSLANIISSHTHTLCHSPIWARIWGLNKSPQHTERYLSVSPPMPLLHLQLSHSSSNVILCFAVSLSYFDSWLILSLSCSASAVGQARNSLFQGPFCLMLTRFPLMPSNSNGRHLIKKRTWNVI